MLKIEGKASGQKTAFNVLAAISFCHLLNDLVQSLVPALYPILKTTFHLDFGHIGLITLTNQVTASFVAARDRLLYRPTSAALFTVFRYGLDSHRSVAALGSSHVRAVADCRCIRGPRIGRVSSRVFAGCADRVGRAVRAGSITVSSWRECRIGARTPDGCLCRGSERSIERGVVLGGCPSRDRASGKDWRLVSRKIAERSKGGARSVRHSTLSRRKVALSIAILLALIFSKYFYLASLTSYYTFYLIQKFGVSVTGAQVLLFVFLGRRGSRHDRRRPDRRPHRT